ncbi:MAG: hypothetical protein HUK14_04095 [Muribaculaceae bacterium]|nr:hypothetical protein [Muribaculaceae bacterium]
MKILFIVKKYKGLKNCFSADKGQQGDSPVAACVFFVCTKIRIFLCPRKKNPPPWRRGADVPEAPGAGYPGFPGLSGGSDAKNARLFAGFFVFLSHHEERADFAVS